jgi:hypothetical protein
MQRTKVKKKTKMLTLLYCIKYIQEKVLNTRYFARNCYFIAANRDEDSCPQILTGICSLMTFYVAALHIRNAAHSTWTLSDRYRHLSIAHLRLINSEYQFRHVDLTRCHWHGIPYVSKNSGGRGSEERVREREKERECKRDVSDCIHQISLERCRLLPNSTINYSQITACDKEPPVSGPRA